MGKNETYWNGLEQYQAEPMFDQGQKHEFSEELPLGESFSEESMGYLSNRRDFLKLFGFGLTAAAITACVAAMRKGSAIFFISTNMGKSG